MGIPQITNDNKSIEQFYGDVKIDFANKYIGGGAFHSGCVQEEIMFVNHPQMFISAVFCEVMGEQEAIQFVGFRKYFWNKGYGSNSSFGGLEHVQYKYDEQSRAQEYISAIDALRFPSQLHPMQFSRESINRELLKAYTGFSKAGNSTSRIITGNWGCGAFRGNIPLKFIIQWLACAMAGKQMVYVPFGAKSKINRQDLIARVSQLTVGDLYNIVMSNSGQLKTYRNIFQVLQHKLGLPTL